MHISCVICSDLFVPTSDVFITGCGHLFHYPCLIQWIERYLFQLNSIYVLTFMRRIKYRSASVVYGVVRKINIIQ